MAATAAMGLSAAFEPRPLEGLGLTGLTNPLGIEGAETVFKVLGTVVAGGVLVFGQLFAGIGTQPQAG